MTVITYRCFRQNVQKNVTQSKVKFTLEQATKAQKESSCEKNYVCIQSSVVFGYAF